TVYMLACLYISLFPSGQILRSSFFSRRRRANSLRFEEMLPGDLERECYEESCSQEEAAEIFQTKEKTLEFWFRYTNLNPCQINPCLNGGICTLDRGDFICLCLPQYSGKNCQSEVLRCHYRNGGCLQYCRDLTGETGVQCGCTEGFKLDPDGQSCSPTGNTQRIAVTTITHFFSFFPILGHCAQQVSSAHDLTLEINGTDLWEDSQDTRIVGGVLEKQGGSPWQVLIHRSDGYGFCGGTLVSDRWVVSAAHCFDESADHVTIGDYDKKRPDPGEQLIKIERVFIHPYFHSFTFDSDIALVYLARPVIRGPTAIAACLPDAHLAKYLLKENNRGVVTGWGLTRFMGRSSRFLRRVALPVVSYKDCIASTEQVITDNMFCAGYLDTSKDACSGDSGGPFMVNYRGTWFLTGVISWGEKCAAKGKYGVYTRLGNFLNWIRDTMEQRDLNGTQS
uniref:Coagulation factor VII, like n=1 Tax=Echeneis naucrates TaxID=173247 RepID=A0A665UTI4_ECHNA